MRFFTPEFSLGFRRFFEALPEAPETEIHTAASLEVARAAARLRRDEGLLVVGIDLAGQEKGYPAEDHREAYQVAHEAFLGKTVHAGEDYGPESIFQAIGDLHADRIGHGTWLFDETKITSPRIRDRKRYVEDLSEFVADKRITIEVCLTSNQQTVPELADDLRKHPFAEMRRRRLSTTFCTDNRLVSHTTVSQEIARAVEAFDLTPREVRDILIYGFKRSFYPGSYLEKRDYVRGVINYANRVLDGSGADVGAPGYQRWKAGWPSFTATKTPRQVAVVLPPASTRRFHRRPVGARVHHPRPKAQRAARGRHPQQPHVELGRDRAGRGLAPGRLHQVDRRGPVRVAVEQRPQDPAAHHAVEGLVVRLGGPLGEEAFAVLEAADVKALRVGGAAAEAVVAGRVAFLDARAIVHLAASVLSVIPRDSGRRVPRNPPARDSGLV